MIRVFTNENCMPCRATKRILDKVGVEYQEISLSEHPEELKRLRDLGFLQAPIVEVDLPDGVDRWSGHVEDKVKAASYLATKEK